MGDKARSMRVYPFIIFPSPLSESKLLNASRCPAFASIPGGSHLGVAKSRHVGIDDWSIMVGPNQSVTRNTAFASAARRRDPYVFREDYSRRCRALHACKANYNSQRRPHMIQNLKSLVAVEVTRPGLLQPANHRPRFTMNHV